ncbi:MAG TPA: universal stress protein [Steroidobacteraceae bacterium]|nr:universal stress protein [Steroidobacteraceae bacterium]
MRRILVAIDGSSGALRALEFAVSQAMLAPTATLHLLMVRDAVNVFGEAAAYVSEPLLRAGADQDCRAALEAARARVGSQLPVEIEVLEGDPAETIVRRAAEVHCESIVMGTRGLGRLELALMGSVAQKVVHTSRTPVTLVH